jgi:AAA+ ATPase superfamily predicted ATPase
MSHYLLKPALEYLEKYNLHVLPFRNYSKHPYVSFTKYFKEKPTKEQVKGWLEEYPNAMIGTTTGDGVGIFILDLDSGYKEDDLAKYLPESLVTPTVITPSGGKHLWFKSPGDEKITIDTGLFPNVDYRCNGGVIPLPPSRNGNGNEYRWVDGLSIGEVELASISKELLIYIKEFIINKYKGVRGHSNSNPRHPRLSTTVHDMFAYGNRDETLFHISNTMLRGGSSQDNIRQVLERLIISWGEEVDTEWVDAKIESALKRAEKRDRNISDEVREYVLSTDGHVLSTAIHATLCLSTKQEKKACSECLRRMIEEGLIERVPPRDGVFRRIDRDAEDIDFMNVKIKPMGIVWPFQLEMYVKIRPKNIVVVAGEQNAGKTAFLLNVAYMNMDQFKINYLSSEMGGDELSERLELFGEDKRKWLGKVRFRDKSSNFEDLIEPDQINIIDFLEITDKFYLIADYLSRYYRKLRDGIAVVGLQKDPKKTFGRGDTMGLEKPRLYMNMGRGTLEIVKAKNWANKLLNPNGMKWDFKLVSGSKFIVKQNDGGNDER